MEAGAVYLLYHHDPMPSTELTQRRHSVMVVELMAEERINQPTKDPQDTQPEVPTQHPTEAGF